MIKNRPARSIEMAGAFLLLALALGFRSFKLASVPGINGDEGWWGVQALSLLRTGHLLYERTTAGNPVCLLFVTPLSWLHRLSEPSFTLLRSLSVFSNFIALALNFWLVRKLFDLKSAIIQLVALAICPTAIAHARFAQEPTLSILATSIVLALLLLSYESQRTKPWFLVAAALFFPAVLWVHPTNIFVLPFFAVPVLSTLFHLKPTFIKDGRIYRLSVILVIGLVCLLSWVLFGSRLTEYSHSNVFLNKPWLALAVNRMTDYTQWLSFIQHYGRLFTGVTIYDYMSGAQLNRVNYDLMGLAFGLFTLAGVVRAVVKRQLTRVEYALVVGWGLSTLTYFLFAGPDAIHPHSERYGLCLIVPGVFMITVGLNSWRRFNGHYEFAATFVAICFGGITALGFYQNYFREFSTSGGRSHQTFVTAQVEPKQAAFDLVMKQSDRDSPIQIVAQQWWHYWPIRYLASAHDRVQVAMSFKSESEPFFQTATKAGNLFLIEFAESSEFQIARKWTFDRGLNYTTHFITDSSARDLFAVMQVKHVLAP